MREINKANTNMTFGKQRIRTLSVIAIMVLGANIASALTLGTYNIRNYNYDQRSRVPTNESELADILLGQRADLLAVQEINEPEIFKLFVHQNLPGYDVVLTQCGGSLRQRLGFIYKKNSLKLESFKEDQRFSRSDWTPPTDGSFRCAAGGRPVAIAQFKRVGKKQRFWALAVHLKAGGSRKAYAKRKQQIALLGTAVAELTASSDIKSTVVMGDFNTTHYSKKGERYQDFLQFVNQNNLKDETANLGCSAYWWGGVPDGLEHPSLLDHVIVNKNFLKKFKKKGKPRVEAKTHCAKVRCALGSVEELGVSYQEVSDHCPVLVKYQ